MADPLSVLGAAAAALQISSQAFELVKYLSGLYGKIKDAPELMQTRISHLEQLIEISKLIAKTPPLQTKEVQKVLQACLGTIMKLQGLLGKYSLEDHGKIKKIVNALKIGNKEDDIAMLLAAIERQKSLLALSIHQIDAAQLQAININIRELHTSIDNASLVITDTAHHVQTIVEILPDIGNQVQGVYQEVPKLAAGIEAIQEHLRVTSISKTPATEPREDQIYAVPNRRVREFVGRESVLARIDDSFNSESEKGPRIVVLRAMGGQGKTQIALEYCRRTRSSTVTVVFWVDASSESALKQSYSSIYEILACQADALLDVDARVNFALRRLRAWRGPWLLVLDNYDNPVEFNNVEDYIPEYKQGMILVTSRHADADGLAKEENRIRLPGLLESEAVELLLSQGKRQKTDQVASSHAKLIVERLGYHPLAIAQAGAYINKRKLPLEEFLDHFQQRKAMILKDTTPQMSQYRRKLEGAEQETSLSVFATWELSYQQLLVEDTEDKCMADLLTLLAFFAAGGVSENLFKAYCDYSKAAKSPSNDTEAPNSPHQSQEPYAIQKVSKGDKHLVPGAFLSLHKQTWDSDLYCDVLATMAHLSLVEGFSRAPDEGYKVALHPLVRDWIRLRTHKSACAEYTYLAATCLHRLLRSGLINNHFAMGFSIGQNLLKHLDAHISNIENLFPQASDVLNESKRARLGKYEVDFGVLWREFGEYAKARDVYRQCLARRNSDIAANDRVTRRHLALLGGVLERLGEYKEAEEIMKKALRIAIEVNGEEHEETIGHMVNLGQVLLAQSLNDEAEEYIRASLRFRERLLGKEDHRTLQSMVDLGRLLAHQQNFREAEKVFRQTLKLLEVALGKEHPYTLITMHNLAEALTSQEEWKEKEDLYRQVLDLEEKLHGREYPGRMQALANLANLMVCMDRYDEAKEMYIQSMTSLEVSLGSNHVLTLGCYGGYGTLFCITGRYEEALPLLQRGYMGFREIFGPQHANTLFHENQLEVLAIELKKKVKNLVNLGRNREAEEIYMQSMKSLEVSLGKSNRSTLCFTTYYGTLLLKTGRYLEALPLLEIVYMRTLELLGPQHADTLRRKQRLEHLLEVIKENNDNIDQKKEDGNVENRFIGVA